MLLYLTDCASRFNLQSLFGSICTNAESLGIRRTHCHRYVLQSGTKVLWDREAVSRLSRPHVSLVILIVLFDVSRFLCPPPTAIMIGNSWWSDVIRRGEDPKLCPPRVVISISGEPAPQEGSIEWTGAAGKAFDVNDPPTGTTYIGRCVGKQLFISDVDEKKKKVEALVKIMAPASDDEPERVIGTFPSRPIKVISKPSKKRQSAKNLERMYHFITQPTGIV